MARVYSYETPDGGTVQIDHDQVCYAITKRPEVGERNCPVQIHFAGASAPVTLHGKPADSFRENFVSS